MLVLTWWCDCQIPAPLALRPHTAAPRRNCGGPISFLRQGWSCMTTQKKNKCCLSVCLSAYSRHVYPSAVDGYIAPAMHMTFKRWKTTYKRNMIKDIRSFLLLWLKNEAAAPAPPPVLRGGGGGRGEEKKLSRGVAEQQNKCVSTRVHFWGWHNSSSSSNNKQQKKEWYDSGCNIRNRFGAVLYHLFSELNHVWQGCSGEGHQSRWC